MPESLANRVRTTLNGAIDDVQTSIVVSDATGLPSVPTFRMYIPADSGGNGEEIVTVTGISGTTLTVTRASESINGAQTASAHSDGAQIILVLSAGGLTKALPRDKVWTPPGGEQDISDEFDDGSLNAAWSRLDYAPDVANVTWTEAHNVLSVKNVGADAGGRYHGLIRSLNGLSYPLTIECAQRYFTVTHFNYFMFGIGFSDSNTWGSGKFVFSRDYTTPNTSANTPYPGAIISGIQYTSGLNGDTANTNPYYLQPWGGPLYTRIVWSAANTFQLYQSGDGVSWWKTISNYSPITITPTYCGIFISNWGNGSYPSIGTLEYFRVYNYDKGASV